MASASMRIATILLTVLAGAAGVHGACKNMDNCRSCATSTQRVGWWIFSKTVQCNWCPLTNTCHAHYSWYNNCDRDHNVNELHHCSAIADSPAQYDSELAEELSKWSSLAYVDPSKHDKTSIQSAVTSQINKNYEVVEFLTIDCDWIFEFDYCGAVIAKSDVDNRVIVAFEGTASPKQLKEQFLSVTQKSIFEPTGGEVLEYNKKTHDRLYPCVKSLVEEILTSLPTAEVIVTGHSLGGAQSQLAGAHLLSDGVVSQSKLHVYTFGSPRVGDKDFAFGYDRLLGDSWRITRKDDPIPLIIPSFLGYHTKKEVHYSTSWTMDASSSYNICESNEDDDSCTGGEGICLTPNCFTDVHQQYFSMDLPALLEGYIFKGTPPIRRMRGTCRSYAI